MKFTLAPKIIFLTSFSMLVLSGCQGLDRTHESVIQATDPDRARLQTSLKWLSPQPRIRPVSADKMYVYCRVRNSSGSDIDLRRDILDEIESLGYRVTRNIDEAQFIVNADLRYLGESATKKHDGLVGSAIIGGIGGAVIGNQAGGRSGEGAAIGAAAGALLGDVIDKRNKDREISLIVDVTIGERVEGGISTKRSSEQDSGVAHSNAVNTGGGLEKGYSDAGSSERQSYEVRDDFFYHENRVVVSAKRLNLTLPEAEPVLVRRISRAISSVLP